jgi:hypothetical protein
MQKVTAIDDTAKVHAHSALVIAGYSRRVYLVLSESTDSSGLSSEHVMTRHKTRQ